MRDQPEALHVAQLSTAASAVVNAAAQLGGEVAERFVDQVKASADRLHARNPASADAVRRALGYSSPVLVC